MSGHPGAVPGTEAVASGPGAGPGAEGRSDPSPGSRRLHGGSVSGAEYEPAPGFAQVDDWPEVPDGLGESGRRLWAEVMTRYSLNVTEAAVLEQACRARDELDRLEREIGAASIVVEGSKGQPRAHPLIGEVRAARQIFARLLAGLRLPDPAKPRAESFTTTRARKAANARWAREKGRHG